MTTERGELVFDHMTPADKQALRDYRVMGRALRELHAATKDLLAAFRKPHRRIRKPHR